MGSTGAVNYTVKAYLLDWCLAHTPMTEANHHSKFRNAFRTTSDQQKPPLFLIADGIEHFPKIIWIFSPAGTQEAGNV